MGGIKYWQFQLIRLFGEKFGKWPNNGKWVFKSSINLREKTLAIYQKSINVFCYMVMLLLLLLLLLINLWDGPQKDHREGQSLFKGVYLNSRIPN